MDVYGNCNAAKTYKGHPCGGEEKEEESQVRSFFGGCNVFVTGATGFFGRILVEKLLRSTDVTTIYLLIRGKKGKNALTRMDEIFDDVVSNCNSMYVQLNLTNLNCTPRVKFVEKN